MRKKKLLITALLISYFLTSFATDYYITSTILNVRTGPGEHYPILFTLPKGDEVVLLSKFDKWYRIDYLGKTGYAHSNFLKLSRSVDEAKLDTHPTNDSSYTMIVCIGVALFIVFYVVQTLRNKRLLETVTNTSRGTNTERKLVLRLLKSGMPAECIFHDLYLKKPKGDFSQIDLVAVTEVGLIVFEVKDYSGWLFGNGVQSNWTQVLAYGRQKYRFYNPVVQNSSHIAALKKKMTGLEGLPFYSVIVFYGNCILKDISLVPAGTFIVKSPEVLKVVEAIMQQNKPFYYRDKDSVCGILKEAVVNGEIIENRELHIENIRRLLDKPGAFD